MSQLYDKNDPHSIQKMFTSIAKSYDRTNAILSFQLHRWWNRQLISKVLTSNAPSSYLDLCAGTGEIAYSYLKKAQHPCCTYLLDFSEGMLECAKTKLDEINFPVSHQFTFLQADAQSIPLEDNSVQCTTIAYGIRNIKNPKKSMEEVFRVLKPGGYIGILELTQPNNSFMRLGHSLYLKTLVPVLGYFFSHNQQAYQYLCRSIQSFIKPGELKKILIESGFNEITIIPLSGGISTILIAKKPIQKHKSI